MWGVVAWCGVVEVPYGVVWYGAMCCGVEWSAVLRCGVVSHGVA